MPQRAPRARRPLPYLFVCAFIANAASFVLPISNPANLVVYGAHMPHLLDWLRQFTLPSIASIVVTYLMLRLMLHRPLATSISNARCRRPALSFGGKLTAWGIVAIGVVLVSASALDVPLGLPTFLCGAITAGAVLALARQSPVPLREDIAWGVLPLVAGLFVMVEALVKTGVIAESERAAAPGGRAIAGQGDVAGRHRDRDSGQCREQSPRRICSQDQSQPAITCRNRSPRRS